MTNKKQILFSYEGVTAFGKVDQFNDVTDFINSVKDNHQYGPCIVENVKIECCISTIDEIEAGIITPLSNTGAVIEKYYVADITEISLEESSNPKVVHK